jgi:hypothetical protein
MSEDEPPLPSDFVAPDAPAPPPSVPALPPQPPRANDDVIVVNNAVTFVQGTITLNGMTRSEFTSAQATLFSTATSRYIDLAAGPAGVTFGGTAETTDNGFTVGISVLISDLDDKNQVMAKLLTVDKYLVAVQSYLPLVTEISAQNVREESLPLSSGDDIAEEDMKEYGGAITGVILFLVVGCPFLFTFFGIFSPDGKIGRTVQIILGEAIFNRLRILFALEPRYAHTWMPKSLAR